MQASLRRSMTPAIWALCLIVIKVPAALAQGVPTATQPIHLSVFGGATGTETGLNGGRNLGVTLGADLAVLPFHGIYPSLEIRGTLPLDGGQVDSQKNILGGLRLGFNLRYFHPYGDALFGRAEITYLGKGLQVPGQPVLYTQSPTNVLAGGGGIDIDINSSFALKLDGQIQHMDTPVTTTGHVNAEAYTAGVVYRIGGGWHHRPR